MKLLLSLIVSIFMTTSAFAHVSLVSSMPADGAKLDMAPHMVMLTFSEESNLTGFDMVNENGDAVAIDELPKGLTAMAHISVPTLTSGKYTITWHAASKDMHAMSGTVTFTVK